MIPPFTVTFGMRDSLFLVIVEVNVGFFDG